MLGYFIIALLEIYC